LFELKFSEGNFGLKVGWLWMGWS